MPAAAIVSLAAYVKSGSRSVQAFEILHSEVLPNYSPVTDEVAKALSQLAQLLRNPFLFDTMPGRGEVALAFYPAELLLRCPLMQSSHINCLKLAGNPWLCAVLSQSQYFFATPPSCVSCQRCTAHQEMVEGETQPYAVFS